MAIWSLSGVFYFLLFVSLNSYLEDGENEKEKNDAWTV